MYTDYVKARICQLGFNMFKHGDCGISNIIRSRRRPTLKEEFMKENIELDFYSSRDLTKRKVSYLTAYNKLGKTCNNGILFPRAVLLDSGI